MKRSAGFATVLAALVCLMGLLVAVAGTGQMPRAIDPRSWTIVLTGAFVTLGMALRGERFAGAFLGLCCNAVALLPPNSSPQPAFLVPFVLGSLLVWRPVYAVLAAIVVFAVWGRHAPIVFLIWGLAGWTLRFAAGLLIAEVGRQVAPFRQVWFQLASFFSFYVFLGGLFALLYRCAVVWDPSGFDGAPSPSWSHLVRFSLRVLTAGESSILIPNSELVNWLVVAEGTAGLFLLVVYVSVLIGSWDRA